MIFWTKFAKKGIDSLKQKNRTFSRVHGRSLLYQTFPDWGRQTQRHFNVSSQGDKNIMKYPEQLILTGS